MAQPLSKTAPTAIRTSGTDDRGFSVSEKRVSEKRAVEKRAIEKLSLETPARENIRGNDITVSKL